MQTISSASRNRITLRALETSDWDALLDFEIRNRAWFAQHVDPRDEAFYCKAGVQAHIADYLRMFAAECWFPGLLLDQAGAIVGRTNLKEVDVARGTAELGYRIGGDYVGNGFATEAVLQAKTLAHQLWGLRWLEAVVKPANLASIRVLKKCGFVEHEHTTDAASFCNGTTYGHYQCSLPATVAQN